MPLLVGPIAGLSLGALLAWISRAEAPREDEAALRTRSRVALLFAALCFAPACAYFAIFAGDWALFYLADSRDVPSAISLVVLVIDALSVLAGFRAGYAAARRRADRALYAAIAAPLAVTAALLLAFFARLREDGTFHQVSARFGTRPVAGGPLGWAILWMGAMIAAGVIIAARALGERPRVIKRPPPAAPEGKQPLLGRKRA